MIFSYDNDKIYFVFSEMSFRKKQYYRNPTEENLPCWHPHEGMLIYINSRNARIVDLIRYCINVPKELSFESVHKFYEDVWEFLREIGYTNDNAYNFEIILADSHDVYSVGKNGIIDRDDKLTCVSGSTYSQLVDAVPKDLPPVERIKEYYRLENKFYGFRNTPLILMSTDEIGVKVIDF